MNTKVLLAALAAALVSFLLGWVIWDMCGMMNYYSHNMTPGYNALMKQKEHMKMMGMIISNLAWGLLIAWSLWKMGVASAMDGLLPGLIIGVLVAITMDMFFYSMMNMYANKRIVMIDVAMSGVTNAILGAVAGFVLGRRKPAA